MRLPAIATVIAALLCLVPVPSRAAPAPLLPYTQNFEGLAISDPAALGNDGWLVYGNVYSPDHSVYMYGYGPFPAPNGTHAFCDVDTLQGGPLQGVHQLSVYSDYNNNGAHSLGQQVESNVYHEQNITALDVGNTWTFQFDAKLGNLIAPSTALAFVKTLNPSAGYVTTNFLSVDMTSIPATWNTFSIPITVDASLVGQLMQFGFANTASNFVSSGVFYDNVVWKQTAGTGVGSAGGPPALALGPAAPNPLRGATRLDWSLARRGAADLGVYDVAGRRVATLFSGVADAGPHLAAWDGRASDGRRAASGVYWCVLRTEAGQVSRKLVVGR